MRLNDASVFSAALDINRANCHDLIALEEVCCARAPARAVCIVYCLWISTYSIKVVAF